MSLEAAEYRRIMGHFVTGVTVVCARDPETGRPRGLTANAITSVSLDPPLVLVCIERNADSHDAIAESEAFAISILRSEDERLSRRFATYGVKEKFDGVAYREEVTGSPVLEKALGWLDCEVYAAYDGGDHTIFVGRVLAGDADAGVPLLYYRGGYGRFVP